MGHGGQGININGPPLGGSDNQHIVFRNKIFVKSGATKVWGVLVSGIARNIIISDNYIEGGTTAGYSAIGVISPATSVYVDDNVVYNWRTNTAGVFLFGASSGRLSGNRAYSSSSPLIGTATPVPHNVIQRDNSAISAK